MTKNNWDWKCRCVNDVRQRNVFYVTDEYLFIFFEVTFKNNIKQ